MRWHSVHTSVRPPCRLQVHSAVERAKDSGEAMPRSSELDRLKSASAPAAPPPWKDDEQEEKEEEQAQAQEQEEAARWVGSGGAVLALPPEAPPKKRGRGRPPGSKNRQAASLELRLLCFSLPIARPSPSTASLHPSTLTNHLLSGPAAALAAALGTARLPWRTARRARRCWALVTDTTAQRGVNRGASVTGAGRRGGGGRVHQRRRAGHHLFTLCLHVFCSRPAPC